MTTSYDVATRRDGATANVRYRVSDEPMHGPTRVDFGAATNIAYCTECTWRSESTTRERVRQAARQHAALEHRDKRARWAYDQANHRARVGGAA